MESLKEELKGN